MSLLEDAKKIVLKGKTSKVTTEQMEAAVAWLEGEVTRSQITKAAGKSTVPFETWIKAAYQAGMFN